MTTHEIELQILEAITRGGARRITWHVKQDDDWVSAAAFPGVRIESQDNGPGMVWHRHLHLSLPVGAQLMRVESSPDRRHADDLVDYLWSARRGAHRQVNRTFFTVGPRGQLLRREPRKCPPPSGGSHG